MLLNYKFRIVLKLEAMTENETEVNDHNDVGPGLMEGEITAGIERLK